MKNIFFPILLLFAFSLKSVYAGVFQIPVTEFEVVNLKVPAKVAWSDDDSPGCVLDCNQETKDNIEFVQEGKTLTIKWKSDKFRWSDKSERLLIKLQSGSLTKVSLSGSGEFVMKNTNDSDNFEYSINGSGDLIGMINAKVCQGTINGSGNALLGGMADKFTTSINGSGDLKAIGMKCKVVEVRIAGSGDAEVFAQESLDVKISGSGSVQFKGDPKKLEQKVSGSGTIKKV